MPTRPQPPVIVLPGITATTLLDLYPVEPEVVWSAGLQQAHERVALHPDNQPGRTYYEAVEPARVVPANPFGVVYGDLVEALRYDLTSRADRPVPVFGFGYDWRQDCAVSARRLATFIDEVLARTALMPHYRDAPPREVDLVGHSMGGLVIAGYLASAGVDVTKDKKATAKVRRVVTLGAPFRGSIDSVQKVAMGMGLLTGPDPKDREREAARTIPSLYQLLPTYKGAFTFAAGLPADLFDPAVWQPSILATLGQFIRLSAARKDPATLLSEYLAAARTFVGTVNALRPERVLEGGLAAWLPIVGMDAATHTRGAVTLDAKKKPYFGFAPPVNDYPATADTGDNTIPLAGAKADFLPLERLVGVRKEDLSFWEFRDRLLVEVGTFHAFLPRINHVHKLVIRFLRDDLAWQLRAWPVPGVARPAWPAWLGTR
jgi:pimeloyl-ACP methyl ester carboxylesterase